MRPLLSSVSLALLLPSSSPVNRFSFKIFPILIWEVHLSDCFCDDFSCKWSEFECLIWAFAIFTEFRGILVSRIRFFKELVPDICFKSRFLISMTGFVIYLATIKISWLALDPTRHVDLLVLHCDLIEYKYLSSWHGGVYLLKVWELHMEQPRVVSVWHLWVWWGQSWWWSLLSQLLWLVCWVFMVWLLLLSSVPGLTQRLNLTTFSTDMHISLLVSLVVLLVFLGDAGVRYDTFLCGFTRVLVYNNLFD